MSISATGSASRYRSLVDGSLDPVLIADASGRWVMANPAAESLLGFERDELLRVPLSETVAHGLEQAATDDGGLPLESGWRGALLLRGKSGKLLPVEGWTIRLHDDLGNACALFVRSVHNRPESADTAEALPASVSPATPSAAEANRDPQLVDWSHMAERTRAEEELQAAKATAIDANRALGESEARFRGAFDAASIGMALVAIDGRFLQVNPALCGIIGYGEEELLGKAFPEITHPDHLDTDRALVEQLLNNEITTYQIEKFYLRKQGEEICGRLTVSLVRDSAGAPLYFVSQIQDITPFKAAGAALRAAEERYRTLVEQTPAAVYVDAAGAGPCCLCQPAH